MTAPPPPVAGEAETVGPDTEPAPAALPAETPAQDTAPQNDTAGAQSVRYRLEIVCDEDTWLKIIVDDAPAEEYFLKPGDTLQLTANSTYNLLIGNAGGVSVQLNGQPVAVPGKSGEVVNLQLP